MADALPHLRQLQPHFMRAVSRRLQRNSIAGITFFNSGNARSTTVYQHLGEYEIAISIGVNADAGAGDFGTVDAQVVRVYHGTGKVTAHKRCRQRVIGRGEAFLTGGQQYKSGGAHGQDARQ